MTRRCSFLLCILGMACSDDAVPQGGNDSGPTMDGGVGPDADRGPRDGGSVDGGSVDDPDPGQRFLTDPPPYPACTEGLAFHPEGGYSGLVNGQDRCGPASPNCPTSYIPGNSGDPCDNAADCTGKDPVCLTGPKYPGGVCAATGCEYGSNFGCPAGDFCMMASDGQTYCLEGCGIDETSCFKHCPRDGYACFTSESTTLGYCLGVDGTRQCNPTESALCTMPSFGDGVCGQTAWDDQTVGSCFETCDVYEQDCSRDGHGCYLLFEYPGYPVCFQSQGEPQGSSCVRTTECAEGLRCSCDNGTFPCTSDKHCRTYCSADGEHPCPSGFTCRPINAGGNLGSCEPQ